MTVKILSSLVISISAMAILSCSTHPYKNRSSDYVNVQEETYDLSGIQVAEDAMEIPDGEIAPFNGKEVAFKAPRPQPLALKEKLENIQIRELAARKWIWLNWQTAQIWVDLYAFIDAQKLRISSVNARQGIILTQTPKGTLELNLKQGLIRNTSELHLNPNAKSETSLTNEYRGKLVDFLTKKREKSISLIGLNLEKQQNIEIVTKAYPYLLIDFSLARTLLEMDLVLTQFFTTEIKKLEDKNFSKQEFYLKYVSGKQNLEEASEADFLYTLKLSQSQTKTKVEIFKRDYKKVDKAIAEEILRFIQRQFQ